jgi:hypothetical protein
VLLLLQDDLRGHHLPDSGERAYVISKTYILMATTRELARRLEGTGVDVMAGDIHTTKYSALQGLDALCSESEACMPCQGVLPETCCDWHVQFAA